MQIASEWRRTCPDRVVYLPADIRGHDGYNDHFLVDITPGGQFLAVWTQGSYEGAPDLRVMCSRSADSGVTWSSPVQITVCDGKPGPMARFGFPVMSRSGRIYCFYNSNPGTTGAERYFSGALSCVYSDDDGITWRAGHVEFPYRRTSFDHPDSRIPCNCIVWQKPTHDSQGRQVVGFSRWSSFNVFPRPAEGHHLDSSSELMRFENIDEGPAPRDIKITWFPELEGSIRVPCPIEPERSRGYSLCEEPSVALLEDGRLFMVMRTVTGRIWYTVSDNDGLSWRRPEVLRYTDNGAGVLHPKSPCPLYQLWDGRYLLFLHNHDGFGYGAKGPWDMSARRPLFLALGEFRAGAHQPIWFSEPKLFCDTQGIGVGPENLIWLAMYSSLTEYQDKRIFWYPDRKHFLLGRLIPDEWLEGMRVHRA